MKNCTHLFVSPISHPKPPNWSAICYLYASKCSQICHAHPTPFISVLKFIQEILHTIVTNKLQQPSNKCVQEMPVSQSWWCTGFLRENAKMRKHENGKENTKTGKQQGKRENGQGNLKMRKPENYIQIWTDGKSRVENCQGWKSATARDLLRIWRRVNAKYMLTLPCNSGVIQWSHSTVVRQVIESQPIM